MQKKGEKKLTNASFDFTHTYTLKKLKKILFSRSVHGKVWKVWNSPLCIPLNTMQSRQSIAYGSINLKMRGLHTNLQGLPTLVSQIPTWHRLAFNVICRWKLLEDPAICVTDTYVSEAMWGDDGELKAIQWIGKSESEVMTWNNTALEAWDM